MLYLVIIPGVTDVENEYGVLNRSVTGTKTDRA